MTRLQGLPPIIDEGARVLILGSFPSTASLAAGQYYAHRQNQFWRLLSALLAQPLTEMDYAARQAAVKVAGLAIWDVYRSCERNGSLDAAIRDGEGNDLRRLHRLAPRLELICFNGRTAARFEREARSLGYAVAVLPSTSPAYTLAFEEKLRRWQAALGGVTATTTT